MLVDILVNMLVMLVYILVTMLVMLVDILVNMLIYWLMLSEPVELSLVLLLSRLRG